MKKVSRFWKDMAWGAMVFPSSGAQVYGSNRPVVSPASGDNVSSTSGDIGDMLSPTSGDIGDMVSPTSGDKVSSTSGDMVSPTSGAKVSPTSGTKDSPTSGAKVSPTSGTKVSSTSGTKDSPTSGAKASPSSGDMVSTSGTKASATSGDMVSPTSPGSSGMGAKRPNFRKEDMSEIHRAARKDKVWKLLLLLQFDISDLNEKDKKGRTALHVACAYGHPRMVRFTMKKSLLNLCDSEKKTPLIHALQYQNMDCAAILLNEGVDPNIMDNDGNTALHYAVLGDNTSIVEWILSLKANIEARNKDDLTPLALAKLANNEKMVKLLVSKGAKDDQSKQQITSEEKGPQESESHTPVTDQQETQKQAWTETKSMTEVAISDEDSLRSHQKITSEYKEENGSPKFESHTPVIKLRKTRKEAWAKKKSMTVIDVSEEDSFSSKQPLTSGKYKEERGHQKSEGYTPDLQKSQKQAWTKTKSRTVVDTSEEDSLNRLCRKHGLDDDSKPTSYNEDLKIKGGKKKQKSNKRKVSGNMCNAAADDSDGWSQKRTGEHTDKQMLPVMESEDFDRFCRKHGLYDYSKPASHNEDLKVKVISETHTRTAKTSKNQSKRIHLLPLHLEKMTQESKVNRACDKQDRSAYSGHPSEQKDEEMCIKQGTLEQRKNLQLSKDESKQKSHEFSVKLKMTEYSEEEPLRDKAKGRASLRQMPSNLSSKVLDCERKDTFGKSVFAALHTFPEQEETTLKIVSPSHADPGSPEDSFCPSFSLLCLREMELHSKNDHKPDADHVLNKNEESSYNDTESKKVRIPVVTSEVREDQEFAMQMTKNMNPNTTYWKLGIRPTPQFSDPKSNETKAMIQIKSHDMPAVTNTYTKIKPNQDLFQKPLCANHCSANYCKSVDSKLKDESSSALHNVRTLGVCINEELQQYLQRFKNDIDMLKVDRLAWKKEIVQLQKEVEEKKKQNSSKRQVSGNMYEGADDDDDDDSIGLSQQSTSKHTNNQQPSDEINENTVIFMNKVKVKMEQKSSKREASGNVYEGADDDNDNIGLSQQSTSEHTDNKQSSDESNEITVIFMKKVEEKKEQTTSKMKVSGNMDVIADGSDSGGWTQQSDSEQTDKQQVSIMEEEASYRLCSTAGIDDDSKPASHNEDLKDKVISETHTQTAKTSKNQSKRIHLPSLHLEKMTQESKVNRACDKQDRSAHSGHPSEQKDKEMCIKQGTLEQRKNLQLSKEESKQKSHEFSVKLKMTEYSEEEPLRDNTKGRASLRQMPSNLSSKMLDCERKDTFGKSVSAALQTFPEQEETTLKIVSPSHADPGSPEDSFCPSFSLLCLREMELRYKNDHKSDAEHVLNKNEESSYNDTESKKVRIPVVTSEVREDQEFAMQMTKNMNPNASDWKFGIGPTPQSGDPKCNEMKPMIEIKRHDMPVVTNTYMEMNPNQDLFQKPLCANYCKSVNFKLKDENSSSLHNDRTSGVYVNEPQQDLQRFKNDIDMLKVDRLAWKKEIVQLQKEVEEKKKQKSSKRKVSGNMCNAAADDSDGWSQKRTGEHTDKQTLPVMESEDSYRFSLREEKEKRQTVDVFCEKNRVQLRKKEEHSIKEVEMHPQLETTIRTQDMPLEIIRENEVSKSSDKEKSLLHENHMLWDDIAKLKLDIDTITNKTQEMEIKYIEDIVVVKEKNDHLRKTITETVFQHNTQLEVLRAERIMLNRKLENEQVNRERLEAEIESYRSRLATPVQDHEHCQTSKRHLQLASQRERDEWLCLGDKINFDMSNLKHNNEILSQQLSKEESKIKSLENELCHTRDAHKERTLVLERDLSHKQCQKEETKHMYEEEQGKVDKDIAKQESLLKRISHLESENMLLQQQPGQTHNKADRKGKTVINTQDQILEIIKIFDKFKNDVLMVSETIKKLINEWNHFKEIIHQYENDNVKKDATVKQLQQELADTKQKLSTIEFFLEIESRHDMHLEDKKQDFKNNLDQSRSQNDELIARFQPAASKRVCLNEEKTCPQELSMEALLKKREELKAEREKWKQRAINLRTDMKMHMSKGCAGEKYKQKIEESIKGFTDNVTQLDLFLQTQRESQETSEQLICMHNASVRSHLEHNTRRFPNFSR